MQGQTESFDTSADIDFLFDFSPLTAELHLALNKDDIKLEQAFGRYSVNRDFNFSFGRQLTVLGYEADEAPGLFAVTNGYYLSDKLAPFASLGTKKTSISQTRRNYVDGVSCKFQQWKIWTYPWSS
jgi:hypothetical protein